ncbi:MAG TPA: acetoacetate--CoA ligase [Ignavibacteriaceae bacterium]|nr:acetoacetate--CoA ligase [Ignavibacteriaceae bacterium]
MEKPLWIPSEERVSQSNLTAFTRYVEELLNKKISSYGELHHWSVTDIEEFWKSIWIISGLIHSKPYKRILSGTGMFGTKWFEGAELNFAENLLRHRDEHTALISSRENSSTIRMTYSELYKTVAALAESFRKMGIKRGDRVAGFVNNIPESIIGMLAAVSLGALWSSCSPDFGHKGVLDRFGQIQPKILLAIESYYYNGKLIDCTEKIEAIRKSIPSIETTILIKRFNDFNGVLSSDTTSVNIDNSFYFNELISDTSDQLEFEQVPFDHPVYIMYSSGTTGIPKCIVHGGGGTLLQHFKELVLHTNLRREDVITYYTTCGWMMWNWLVSSLSVGASIFLYDGSPVFPNRNSLWKKIEEEKISIFGTSPKFLTMIQKSGLIPKESFDLSSLKIILSTGSPLSVENFKWVYENVKNDLQLSSISGGTDIVSCFMLGNPNLPVYAGEIQSKGLGMKVEAFNEKGESVIEQKGELVCTKPFPSMPVYFWNDPERSRYRAAYFDHYPDVWRHGDYIKITENGGIIVYGRSDATLNPGGVRIGTAEIYRVVEAMEEITDSLVIGQNWRNDVRIILFVVLKQNHVLNDKLIDKIKDTIRKNATPRHVPARIVQVSDIPRTISGKKVELAVTRIIHNEKVENRDALANPDSLDQFKKVIPYLSE